ncbi:MAG TPA: sugar phosphate nucleotidyltransferase [Thermoanaerobaculia bacterium]|nr:sugar phosphate nucleotidyltransferase [Thermoanaerobaculia bacterium]
MKAVILTGGLGTRLRPLTFSIPKPLAPIGEKAILQLLLERLAKQGITDAILCTGYFSELIRAFCGDGSRFGLNCTYVHEAKPLGTAGPISLLRDRLPEGEDFLVINGDVVTKLDFAAMVASHRASGKPLTVGYTEHVYTSPFGVLDVEGDHLVGIREKPVIKFPISCGIYAVSGRAVSLVPDDVYFTMPDLMRACMDRGEEVGVYYIREYWHGVESLADLEAAAQRLSDDPAT